MPMGINYLLISLVVAAVIVLVVWVVRKNRKDRKDLEKTINASDVKPEQHEDDAI
jgi:hypothetical protein